MMGMGFLRLNKILAKHKWHRKDIDDEEQDSQESRQSSLVPWLVVMVVLVLSVLIFGIRHASKFV